MFPSWHRDRFPPFNLCREQGRCQRLNTSKKVVDMLVVMQRLVPMIAKVPKTVEILQVLSGEAVSP